MADFYAALVGEFGNERDVGAILSLNDGPFFTMIALGAAGDGEHSHYGAGGGAGSRLVVGMILGNLDLAMRFFDQKAARCSFLSLLLRWGRASARKCYCKADLPEFCSAMLTTFVTAVSMAYSRRSSGWRNWHCRGGGLPVPRVMPFATPLAIARGRPLRSPGGRCCSSADCASVITAAILTPVLTSRVAKNRRVRASFGEKHAENDEVSPMILPDQMIPPACQLWRRGRERVMLSASQKPSRRAVC